MIKLSTPRLKLDHIVVCQIRKKIKDFTRFVLSLSTVNKLCDIELCITQKTNEMQFKFYNKDSLCVSKVTVKFS